MKVFVLGLVFISILTFIECAPVASPEANPEPCLEIIFRALQLFLTTTSRPRRREYTTPYNDDEPEPTTESSTDATNTEVQPTADSGESADGPAVDDSGTPNADNPSTSGPNPDDSPNEIIPKGEDTIRKLRKANNKKRNDWWFSGIKF